MTLTTSYWPADPSDEVRPTTVGGVLREAAAAAPGRDAMVAGMPDPADRRRWTYAELLADAEQAAHALLTRFEPGEHVAVWAPNIPEWAILQYGAALAGIVLVTVNPAYQASELEYVLRQSRAAGLFTMPEYRGNPMAKSVESVRAGLPDLREVVLFSEWPGFVADGESRAGALPDVQPQDAAALLYTSGTTGFPKGALLHHRGITNDARFVATRFGMAAGDVQVSPMPLFHVGGCVLAVLGTAAFAGTYIPVLAFDPALVLELVETEHATLMGGVPTMLLAMMEHPDFAKRDLSSLRVVGSGGSTVPAEIVRRIESALGVKFSIVFGQTECSAVATQTRLDDSPDDKAETIGQALPHVEVKVIDPIDGTTVPPGTLGELCVRGFCVMNGYYDMPEATDAAIDPEGWLHTGDLGTMDERGYCRIQGRLKDMIIRGGENIYPREIEAVLYEHDAVADIAVVGIPDDRWGEEVAAFVRLGEGCTATPAELSVHVRERMAHYKVPKQWIFVEAFPLTGSGKVQKFVLREQLVKGELTPEWLCVTGNVARMTRIGLVLGAGGAVGHAFHAGVLSALADHTGWDARDAEIIVGTSAGSLVGAFLRAGLSGPDLAARTRETPMSDDGRALVDRAEAATQHLPPIPSRPPRRQGIPAMSAPGALVRAMFPPWSARPGALAAAVLPEGRISTEIIATGLRTFFAQWPDRALWINAVDLQTSRLVTFGRDGAPPADVPSAVAASCAIPAFFAPVSINGVRYVDGGVHSPTNADLLGGLGLDLVVISSPMSIARNSVRIAADQAARRVARLALVREVARVRRAGTPVLTFQPTAADLAVMGFNAMDPSRRADVARQVSESARHRLARHDAADRVEVLTAAASSARPRV